MGQRGVCAQKRPFDVHEHFSLSRCPLYGYGSIPGFAVLIGDFGGGRERPPFFASRIGTAGWADVHWRATPWEGRSRPNAPCGKAKGSSPERAPYHGPFRRLRSNDTVWVKSVVERELCSGSPSLRPFFTLQERQTTVLSQLEQTTAGWVIFSLFCSGGRAEGRRPGRSRRPTLPEESARVERIERRAGKLKEPRSGRESGRQSERTWKRTRGEEASTRELRENIEGKNDTIASVLNEMAGQGRLKRRKVGKQKVLWSLVRGEIRGQNAKADEALKTGSRTETGSHFPKKTGTGLRLSAENQSKKRERKGLSNGLPLED